MLYPGILGFSQLEDEIFFIRDSTSTLPLEDVISTHTQSLATQAGEHCIELVRLRSCVLSLLYPLVSIFSNDL